MNILIKRRRFEIMKKVKKYEAPALEVTKIEIGDIIMASGTLIDLTDDKLMGKGKIKWIDIN